MVTEDVVLMVPPVLLLHLEGRVVDPLVPAQISQFLEHISFHSRPRENMRNQNSFAGPKVPHMQVMHIDYTLDLLDVVLEFGDGNIAGRGLHHDVVAILGHRVGRDEHNDGEHVGGNGVQVVDVVPLVHLLAHVGTCEEYDQGGN